MCLINPRPILLFFLLLLRLVPSPRRLSGFGKIQRYTIPQSYLLFIFWISYIILVSFSCWGVLPLQPLTTCVLRRRRCTCGGFLYPMLFNVVFFSNFFYQFLILFLFRLFSFLPELLQFVIRKIDQLFRPLFKVLRTIF